MAEVHSKLKQAVNRYFIAQMFLTRLPSPNSLKWSDSELAASTPYFPAVGIVVGLIAALAWLAGFAGWGANLAAIFAVAAGILATGAFHEDGLADAADGIGGAFSIEKKLAIMRDSRVGTYGSVALILIVLTKILALAQVEPSRVPGILITAHVVARWSSLPLIYNNKYVREQGTGKPFAATVTAQRLIAASLFTIICVICCVQLQAIAVVLVAVLTVLVAQWYLRRKLGGITGDVLGAVNSITELLVYLTLTTQLL